MGRLSIIGAGRLGRTLGRLAHDAGYAVVDVLCRDAAHAAEALAFIGAGRAVTELTQLAPADLYLLAVPDAAIAAIACQLAATSVVPAGALVFHASGAGEASLLAPLAARGVRIGSLHPAFSFAEPARAVTGFGGTLCALEGEDSVCAELERLAEALGGRPFRLAPGGKAAYHAALSMASNYLVTLNALALQVAAGAGIDAAVASQLVGGLMCQTLDNTLALGPAAALTGPIVRGDAGTVARHLAVIDDALCADAYRAMGRAALRLAGERLDEAARAVLAGLLDSPG
ncbi:Rossmann-like and DUF2520 domain-containing protein [Pseudogulbenkiania subflava]|uniref:Predicted oxidoreductase, contains short-chain dehydrogenase (SDR) and DUF2520 domains n=1 Tax=Pseudogulbenkiania subflava DSM 22618 TaxID=1123014 RepID=A0A1Y6BPQ4_9NEIS|nr:Rossmann-like and DUF2520 domain-containing protein [Pseudogulbenkiania subflava]SMF20877.1 Predicted oxidoreductase, contains short-chain dehydrogenase (SDR) and DUF2520 domains [Pseudogulbenkiania subflava DSM 22618]